MEGEEKAGMVRARVELRDLEILRTLVRVQFATSPELVSAFFSSDKVGLRRLSKLEKLELITRHTKGAPKEEPGYFAWRLTKTGVSAVARAFPREPIGEAFDERVAERSLGDAYQREALTRLYLQLICGDPRWTP